MVLQEQEKHTIPSFMPLQSAMEKNLDEIEALPYEQVLKRYQELKAKEKGLPLLPFINRMVMKNLSKESVRI